MLTALSCLTRRLGQLGLAQPSPTLALSRALLGSSGENLQQIRFRSDSKKPSKNKGKTGKQKNQPDQKKKPQEAAPAPSLPHEDWIKFQQSISVVGFETGQTKIALTGKKDRGGKKVRRQQENTLKNLKNQEQAKISKFSKHLPSDENRRIHAGGGQFPPMRYSPEETERLLAEAYEAIPPRGGKQGTRNLKRQHLRWFKARKYHAKQKYFKVQAHFRKMEKRGRIVKEVLQVKAEAEEVITKEKAYQDRIFETWAATILEHTSKRLVEDA